MGITSSRALESELALLLIVKPRMLPGDNIECILCKNLPRP